MLGARGDEALREIIATNEQYKTKTVYYKSPRGLDSAIFGFEGRASRGGFPARIVAYIRGPDQPGLWCLKMGQSQTVN